MANSWFPEQKEVVSSTTLCGSAQDQHWDEGCVKQGAAEIHWKKLQRTDNQSEQQYFLCKRDMRANGWVSYEQRDVCFLNVSIQATTLSLLYNLWREIGPLKLLSWKLCPHHRSIFCQQVKGVAPSPLPRTTEKGLGCCVQCWAPQDMRGMETVETVQQSPWR